MKFTYVQIGARDYISLAAFYREALDFENTGDVSYLRGREGVALKAPGFGEDNAPVFGIVKAENGEPGCINDVGYAHICFETTDVKGAVRRFVKLGGSVLSTMKNPQMHPCVYCKDPEGNIVEFHIPFPSKGTFGEYMKTAGSLLHLVPNKGKIKFIHVNIITEDWQKLCEFYNKAFGSTYFGKMKDHSGSYKEQVISIPGVHVVGFHVLLKDFYEAYPTLEIFTYSVKGRQEPAAEDSVGINLIGFTTDNAVKDIADIVDCGGSLCSEDGDFATVKDIQGDIILLRKV